MCVGIDQQFLLGSQTMLQGKLKQTLEKWRIKSRQLSDWKLKMKFHLILSKVCVCVPVYMYMHTHIKVLASYCFTLQIFLKFYTQIQPAGS